MVPWLLRTQSRLAIFVFLGGGAIFLYGLLSPLSEQWGSANPEPYPHFSPALFLVSYQDLGFVKRGLIGSLFDFDDDVGLIWQMQAFIVAANAAFLAAFGWLLTRARDPVLALVVVAAPAFYLQLGRNYGLIDPLLLLGALVTITAPGGFWILLLPLMVLIHEGTLFFFAPLMVLTHIQRFGMSRWLIFSLAASSVIAAIFLLSDPMEPEALFARYPNLPDRAIPQTQTLSIAFNYVMRFYALTYETARSSLFLSGLIALSLIYLLVFARMIARRMGDLPGKFLLLAACFSPLALMPIAHDTMRWIAFCCFNLVFLFFHARESGLAAGPRRIDPFSVFVITVAFLLGPLGIGWPFPWARSVYATLFSG